MMGRRAEKIARTKDKAPMSTTISVNMTQAEFTSLMFDALSPNSTYASASESGKSGMVSAIINGTNPLWQDFKAKTDGFINDIIIVIKLELGIGGKPNAQRAAGAIGRLAALVNPLYLVFASGS